MRFAIDALFVAAIAASSVVSGERIRRREDVTAVGVSELGAGVVPTPLVLHGGLERRAVTSSTKTTTTSAKSTSKTTTKAPISSTKTTSKTTTKPPTTFSKATTTTKPVTTTSKTTTKSTATTKATSSTKTTAKSTSTTKAATTTSKITSSVKPSSTTTKSSSAVKTTSSTKPASSTTKTTTKASTTTAKITTTSSKPASSSTKSSTTTTKPTTSSVKTTFSASSVKVSSSTTKASSVSSTSKAASTTSKTTTSSSKPVSSSTTTSKSTTTTSKAASSVASTSKSTSVASPASTSKTSSSTSKAASFAVSTSKAASIPSRASSAAASSASSASSLASSSSTRQQYPAYTGVTYPDSPTSFAATDYSTPGGYFQPATYPYGPILNGSCTWYTGCSSQNGCGKQPLSGYTAALSSFLFGSAQGAGSACGRCFQLQGYEDPYQPGVELGTPAVIVKVTDKCPAGSSDPLCSQTPEEPLNQYGALANFDLCRDTGAYEAFFTPAHDMVLCSWFEVDCSLWEGVSGGYGSRNSTDFWDGYGCLMEEEGAERWPGQDGGCADNGYAQHYSDLHPSVVASSSAASGTVSATGSASAVPATTTST